MKSSVTINGMSPAEYARKTYNLKQMLEEHDALGVYPFGFDDIGPYVIGEGFIYPDCVFFFDTTLPSPDPISHHGGHILPGKLKGPYSKEGDLYWKVGPAVIEYMPRKSEGEQYRKWIESMTPREQKRHRNQARKRADRYVEEWRQENRKGE